VCIFFLDKIHNLFVVFIEYSEERNFGGHLLFFVTHDFRKHAGFSQTRSVFCMQSVLYFWYVECIFDVFKAYFLNMCHILLIERGEKSGSGNMHHNVFCLCKLESVLLANTSYVHTCVYKYI